MRNIYWLASYPKSGNTWLRILLTNYLRNQDVPADINDLDLNGDAFVLGPFEELLGIDVADLSLQQINYYRPLVYEKMSAEIENPVFLKVHDFYWKNKEGNSIFSTKATAGVIYLVRNPLDVAISFAHHLDKSIDKTIKLMANEAAFLTGLNSSAPHLPQKLSSWSQHITSWIDEPGLNVLVVRYEDMIQDTVKKFSEIIEFVELEFDAVRIKKAVEFSSFDRLKEQECQYGFKERQATSASFFRQGRSGNWRDRLNPSQINEIVATHQIAMRRLGYLDKNKQIVA